MTPIQKHSRLLAGEMIGTVEQGPSKQIRTALQQVVAKIRNGTEMETVIVKPILITLDNIEQAERYSEIK